MRSYVFYSAVAFLAVLKNRTFAFPYPHEDPNLPTSALLSTTSRSSPELVPAPLIHPRNDLKPPICGIGFLSESADREEDLVGDGKCAEIGIEKWWWVAGMSSYRIKKDSGCECSFYKTEKQCQQNATPMPTMSGNNDKTTFKDYGFALEAKKWYHCEVPKKDESPGDGDDIECEL